MKSDFNTSHVTVYPRDTAEECEEELFQYISCYCLSQLRWTVMYQICNFNTSHVTVYPKHVTHFTVFFSISIHLMLLFINVKILKCLFFRQISIHLMLLFIKNSRDAFGEACNFNTSHVTVYLQQFKLIVSTHPHFNTSHVTVYRDFRMH